MFRQCTTCHVWKMLEGFYKRKDNKDGRTTRCIDCTNAYMRKRYEKPEVRQRASERNKLILQNETYREAQKARSRKFYASLDGRARTLLNNASKSPAAKRFGFTLTLEHIIEQLNVGKCQMTGIAFDFGSAAGRKKNHYAPSVDRIDPQKGYTNENTRIVIWQYNMMKGETSDYEVLELCRAVVRNADNAAITR